MRKDANQEVTRLTSKEIDQLLNYFEMLEEKEDELKEEVALVKAKIGAALRAEHGELHPGGYVLQGEHYTLDAEVGETWRWDADMLMHLAEVNPNPHIKVSATIAKAKFQALPDDLKLKFYDALTIKTGKIKLTVRGG